MHTPRHPPPPHIQLGVPDPDRETSPIIDGDGESPDTEPLVGQGHCVFNGRSYAVGVVILSGAEVLRCEAPGVWTRQGELRPGWRVLD